MKRKLFFLALFSVTTVLLAGSILFPNQVRAANECPQHCGHYGQPACFGIPALKNLPGNVWCCEESVFDVNNRELYLFDVSSKYCLKNVAEAAAASSCGTHGNPPCSIFAFAENFPGKNCYEGEGQPYHTERNGWLCFYSQEEADHYEKTGGLPFNLCKQTEDSENCISCLKQDPPGVWTAIGCIPTTSDGILAAVLRVGISIAGGVVLLMILAAGFMLTTSQGEPKKTEEARTLITSAVGGLLFILFSIVILETIGISILRLPGF